MASKRAQRRRQCGHKAGHSTEEGARVAASIANRKDASVGPQASRIQPYRCNHCGRWHIGHRPTKRAARRSEMR